MVARVWTLALKDLLQLWRDKMILLFVFLGPISELALVAWATSGSIEHIPTVIVDRDRSAVSRGLVSIPPLHLDLTDYRGLEGHAGLQKRLDGLVGGPAE